MLPTLDSKLSTNKKSANSAATKLEIVLMCRNRVHSALRAVEAILNQSMCDFHFYVSDNSESTEVLQAISVSYPHVVFKQRGGHLTQFEHMSRIINEASSEYLLITHDDDFLFHNFVEIVFSTLSKTQGFGVLLNRVLRFDEFIMGTGGRRLVYAEEGSVKSYSLDLVISDYLIGRYCNDIYSISMTVFRADLANGCLDSMVDSGSHADACFLIKMCSRGEVFVNETPVGAYEISPDSVSNSLSLRDSKLFLRFLFCEGYLWQFSREMNFFKLRTRFYYSKSTRYSASYRARLLLGILLFLVNPLSLRVIFVFIARRLRCYGV